MKVAETSLRPLSRDTASCSNAICPRKTEESDRRRLEAKLCRSELSETLPRSRGSLHLAATAGSVPQRPSGASQKAKYSHSAGLRDARGPNPVSSFAQWSRQMSILIGGVTSSPLPGTVKARICQPDGAFCPSESPDLDKSRKVTSFSIGFEDANRIMNILSRELQNHVRHPRRCEPIERNVNY
jgi:hypothetical protein